MSNSNLHPLRPLNPFGSHDLASAYTEAAKGTASQSLEAGKHGEPDGSTIRISRIFLFQSYFDDTFLHNALLLQPPNQPIVNPVEVQVGGYAIGLHPSSQTPIAVQFKSGNGASAPLILKPGQVERPHGKMFAERSGAFLGFTWGLPFGWLGGGLATIHVFQTPDADVAWPGEGEVIFHRQRMRIAAVAAVPAAAPLNWPTRFPWSNASYIAAGLAAATPQGGQAAIAVVPTRTYFRLRLNALAAASRMRVVWQGSNDFDLNAAGAVVLTQVTYVDVTWPLIVAIGAPAGNLTTNQFPITQIEGGWPVRSSCDDGGVALIDASGTAALAGAYVDVIRYGRL